MAALSDPPNVGAAPEVSKLEDTKAQPTTTTESPTAAETTAKASTEATPVPTKLDTETQPATTTEAAAKSPIEANAAPATTAPTTAPAGDSNPTNVASSTTSSGAAPAKDNVNPVDFEGDVQTDNKLPSLETLRKLEDYTVLDEDGKSHTFKSLYSGHNVARRVLVVFIRHFFCGVSY